MEAEPGQCSPWAKNWPAWDEGNSLDLTRPYCERFSWLVLLGLPYELELRSRQLMDLAIKTYVEKVLSHQNYYRPGRLAGDPTPYPGQAEPTVTHAKRYRRSTFELSIVIPVHNQADIMARTLDSVARNVSGLHEIIIIADDCTDRTHDVCVEALGAVSPRPGLCQSIIISQPTPVFETTSDNIGFSVSQGEFIIEIQADMQLNDYGFDQRLVSALKKYDDLLGVSGRCTHRFNSVQGVGKLGERIEQPLSHDIDPSKLYMYGTCNRGPLALRKSMLQQLKYLDEKNYYLLDSEHDLFARAFHNFGWRCGYVPTEVISILSEGTTRKAIGPGDREATSINEAVRSMKEASCSQGFLRASRHLLDSVPVDVRSL